MKLEQLDWWFGLVCMMVGIVCLLFAVVITKDTKYQRMNLKDLEEYINERTQALSELEEKIEQEKEAMRKSRNRKSKKQEDEE